METLVKRSSCNDKLIQFADLKGMSYLKGLSYFKSKFFHK